MTTDTTTAAAIEATAPAPAENSRGSSYSRECPECGERFHTNHAGKAFCSEQHRVAFTNRCAARGKTLIPLAMGWRNARGGRGIGAQAMQEMVQLLDQFAAEDRAAGRPNMTGYTDHLLNKSVNLRWKDGRRSTRTGR
jgi:endogenous inhibitor of DNA gyrase (YacG/DUF329 family)